MFQAGGNVRARPTLQHPRVEHSGGREDPAILGICCKTNHSKSRVMIIGASLSPHPQSVICATPRRHFGKKDMQCGDGTAEPCLGNLLVNTADTVLYPYLVPKGFHR